MVMCANYGEQRPGLLLVRGHLDLHNGGGGSRGMKSRARCECIIINVTVIECAGL